MSEQKDEPTTGISDEDLPEDLRPSDDNPLAKPLTEEDDPRSPEELDVLGGKMPEQDGHDTGDDTGADTGDDSGD